MKNFRNTNSAITALALSLLLISCEKKNIQPTTTNTVDKPLYILEIFGADGVGSIGGKKTIVGEHIQSTWDDELGLVWLGTDSVNLPIATVTMEIDSIVYSTKRAIAKDIYISTTDARTGTSAELNAKLYYAPVGFIYELEIGANYFKGAFASLKLTEVNSGQEVTVVCQFRAMNK